MPDTMDAADYVAMQRRRGSKYRNRAVRIDGRRFASMAEGARYLELRQLEGADVIEFLRLQPRYPVEIGGVTVFTYVADFEYWDRERQCVVIEDVKGGDFRTDVYRLKKRVFEAVSGRRITEVTGVDTRGMAQHVIESEN